MTVAERTTFFATEAEWLAARRPLITGSDVPCILGLSPFKTPRQLWAAKVGLLPAGPRTDRQKLGLKLERVILEMLADAAEATITHVTRTLVRHPTAPEFGYSLDGWVRDGRTPGPVTGIAEAKNRAGFGAAAEWADDIPRDVFAQVQHGMDVCDLPLALVGALIAGGEFRWKLVPRDDAWIAEARPQLLDFARRVRDEDAPPAGPDDRDALDAQFPREERGKLLALPPEAMDLAFQYAEAAELEGRGKRGKDDAGNKLREMLGDAEVGILPGQLGKVTWKTQERKPYVVEAGSSRVLRVSMKKENAR